MFLHHVRTRVDGRSNYFCICTRSSTPDFGPRACPVLELQQQAPPARDAATPPARALHKLARRRPDDRWRHRSSAARRDAGQQGDVGPSGSGAGASQHRAVGGPQHVARRPERAGLPGWREGARRTLPLDPSLLPSAPRRARQRASAAEGLPLPSAARSSSPRQGGAAMRSRAASRAALGRVRGVRGTACAACAARRARAAARPAAAAEPRVAVDGPLHRSGRQARSARPTRPTRSRGARAYPPRRVHRAPRPLRLPARPGCTRAAASVGRRARGARGFRGARGGS